MKVTEIDMSMAEIIPAMQQICTQGKQKTEVQACDCKVCQENPQHMIITTSNGQTRVKISVVERDIPQVGRVKHVVIENPQAGEARGCPLGVLWAFANKNEI